MPHKQESLGRIVMIHGVKARQADRNALRRLAPAFRAVGFCVVIPKYGFVPATLAGLFGWIDHRIADSMSAFIQPNDILLGHSNGATLVYLISRKVKIRGAILLNAALDSAYLPDAEFIHVYYNNGDKVSWASKFVPFHPWGDMGTKGYKGLWDSRVVNIDQGNPPDTAHQLPVLDGHSDIFRPGKTRPWAKFMAELTQASLELLHIVRH